ncbi:hypothetical protein [Rhizohabitans arisaemae]|uniref:hypothetical protein n=1 Tax=Rhizohabitans arisaemae TaxID=2720610 RepID=UPI0024B097C7|nr:hypothetical protein [Rhizohabitans arisaemae]
MMDRLPVATLADAVRADEERMVAEWLAVTEHPAPRGAEAARVAVILDLLRGQSGLDEVRADDQPNVYALRKGRGDGPRVALLATLDDLNSAAALRRNTPVVRGGNRLVGPCVNTTSSDATVLAVLRHLENFGLRGGGDLLAVFVSGEETGLTGVRRLLRDERGRIDLLVDVMGGIGTISYNAIGRYRLEVRFEGVSRHTLRGGVSEIPGALARTVLRLEELAPANDDSGAWRVLRVNGVDAGDVDNHSPASGRLVVDLRGTSQGWLEDMRITVGRVADEVAAAAGITAHVATVTAGPAVELPGGAGHALVRAAGAAVAATGHPVVLRPWTSSNVNAALECGVPGIAMEGTRRGDGRGTPDEWCDIAGVSSGVLANTLLVAALTDP